MNVIVTGAAGGIGLAVAERLAAGELIPGPHRMLLVDRDGDRLAQAAAPFGETARTLVVDVSQEDCGERIAAAALEHMGGIDGVASNAGVILGGALADLSAGDFGRMFSVNTRATWLIAKACLPHLRASRGVLVATASMSGSQPTPALGFYSASKAALLMLVRQMSVEWGPDGVRCNTVSPGPTLTPMTAAGYADQDRRDEREAGIPLRKLGTAEDVASAIVFLLSPHASHISGVDVLVDGGMSNMLMAASGAGRGQAPKP